MIAADGLGEGLVDGAHATIANAGGTPAAPRWIEPGIACDIPFDGLPVGEARAALESVAHAADLIVQPEAGRAKRLLVADMDSTMITVECIDELADYAGLKPQVAAVTERAMRGELDFEAALDARVALLAGMDVAVLERCHAERVRITPGARALVGTMRAHGARTVLVSGGFTHFADRVAAAIGFDRALSNRLDIGEGRLTGTVGRPIVGAETKRLTMIAEAGAMGIDLAQVLAIGDGANDLPMVQAAGLGVAYHAKPVLAASAAAAIRHGDLTTLLYAQGYPRSAWTA